MSNVRIAKGEQTRKNKKRKTQALLEGQSTSSRRGGRLTATALALVSPPDCVPEGKKRGRPRKRGVRFDVNAESAGSVSTAQSSVSEVSSANSELYSEFDSQLSLADTDDRSECASEASYVPVDEPPNAVPKKLRKQYWGKVGALCWVRLPTIDWNNNDSSDAVEGEEEEKLCKIIGVSEYETKDVR